MKTAYDRKQFAQIFGSENITEALQVVGFGSFFDPATREQARDVDVVVGYYRRMTG